MRNVDQRVTITNFREDEMEERRENEEKDRSKSNKRKEGAKGRAERTRREIEKYLTIVSN